MHVETALRTYTLVKPLYQDYFRVQSSGHEHVPTEGRAILVANHSGAIPIDGMMIAIDLISRLDPPRLMRAVVDRFVAGLPYVNILFSRVGQIIGIRRNFETLLEHEELVLVFPEGTPGIVKPWGERYQLRKFNVGFVELHLRYRAPIIPVSVVGAEEQYPILAESRSLGAPLGVTHVPIPLNALLALVFGPIGALPFPTRYHITYGEPIRYYEEFSEDTIRNPVMVKTLAEEVQSRVQAQIRDGLRQRKGIFA
jgi:1-acyl-sn-glycerol-3-phosphate acyltransferase